MCVCARARARLPSDVFLILGEHNELTLPSDKTVGGFGIDVFAVNVRCLCAPVDVKIRAG